MDEAHIKTFLNVSDYKDLKLSKNYGLEINSLLMISTGSKYDKIEILIKSRITTINKSISVHI